MEKKNKKIDFDMISLFGRNETSQVNIEEVFGRDKWIGYGKKNDLPTELVRLFQNADGLHAALIKRKADMIAGVGFEESTPHMEFIKNSYSKESLEKIAYKMAFDVVLFGGYYLNIVWGANGQKIARIEHVPFEKVRIAKPEDEITCDISGFYLSRDWAKWRREENTPKYICAFEPENEQKRIEEPSQLLFVKIYNPSLDYYALPSYTPIINYLKLSYEISTFHLKSCQNGYLPGLIISIPHVPPPEEREKMSEEIKLRSGTDESNKTVVVYGEDKDKLPTFTILDAKIGDEKFRDLSARVNENIFVGHNANATIAGIQTAGKLSNSSEIIEQYTFFQASVIQPLQKNLEDTFNMLAEINGLPKELKLANYITYLDKSLKITATEGEVATANVTPLNK